MIYLVYRMRLTERARRDMKGFYKDLPMVEEVRWYYSVIGDVYTLENWAAFDDEAAWGAYRAALAGMKTDDSWEAERVSQETWWDSLGTRIVTDPPVPTGFRRPDDRPQGETAGRARAPSE